MRKVKAKVRAGILIPLRQLEEYELDKLQEQNTWHNYLDKYACAPCPENHDKPTNCGSCPNYEKHEFFTRKMVKNEPCIIVRKGSLRSIKKFFKKELSITDRQSVAPMSEVGKYRFNYALLNPGQKEAHDVLVDKLGNGISCILKSPPRTGKTVMAASIIITLQRKTIFLAHQQDLLIGKGQLISTFTDKTSDTAPINPGKYFTNIRQYMDEGETPVKYCRTLEDFESADICLTTYQVFLHPRGKEILKKIKDKFGLLVVDECHRTGSSRYSDIIDKFSCPRLGLSATPKRKDGRHRIMHSILGNVEHETAIKSLTPTVSVIRTGFASKKMYKNWVYFLRFLEQSEKRMNRILSFIKKDASKGRSILIPVAHHSQVDSIVEELKYMGVTAVGWDGRLKGAARQEPLRMSAEGEVSVIVAQRSMLTGINIPRWDMLYWIVPMNNEPNFEQEYKRICTPMPNKPTPVVRFFVDDHEVVERCYFNSANVIKRDGGQFTESALQDWTAVGQRLGKIKPPKPRACKEGEDNKSSNGVRRAKSMFSLTGDYDADMVDEDTSYSPAPKKTTKDVPAKKTSHLKRLL